MRIKMLRDLDGMIEGVVMPRRREVAVLPDDIARTLLLLGVAEKVEDEVPAVEPEVVVAPVVVEERVEKAPETATAKRTTKQ